jgi:hypothetical protein
VIFFVLNPSPGCSLFLEERGERKILKGVTSQERIEFF